MADIQTKKLNNLNFYGVSYRKHDDTDIKTDLITNIRKRFLVTKKAASNKLYRSAAGVTYIYSYSFSFDRPLQWRVTRNKRVIEELIPLHSDKYCVVFYDENGKEYKKVFFDSKHRWFKTNYYSSVENESLICSIVPKELDTGTSILMYITGEVYPHHLYPCNVPSCDAVRERLLGRIPTPSIEALTDRGIVYFMPEEDKNIYEDILAEEEAGYAEEHSPKIYVSQEDIDSGFKLDVSDFDMSKNLNRTLDISLAKDFDEENSLSSEDTPVASLPVTDVPAESEDSSSVFDDGSVNAAISMAVDKINQQTSLNIDTADILNIQVGNLNGETSDDFNEADDRVTFDNVDSELNKQLEHIDSVLDGSSILTEERKLIVGDSVVDDDYISSIIDGIISSVFVGDKALSDVSIENIDVPAESDSDVDSETSEFTDVIKNMDEADSDISENEDFIASSGEINTSDTAFDSETEDATINIESDVTEDADNADSAKPSDENSHDEYKAYSGSEYLDVNPADSIVESRGESYYYYGSLDASGKRHGRGRTLMSDGSIAYEGDYADDKRKGVGSFYFKDGSLCYWGNWDDNVRVGFGVGVNSDDKSVHVGNWQQNKPQGVGIRFDKDGNLMFLSSSCDDKKKGITISDVTDTSFVVRVWSDKDEAYIQHTVNISDIIK